MVGQWGSCRGTLESDGGGVGEVRTEGIGGKKPDDKYKWLDTSTTPQDICDILVKFDCVYHVQRLSAITAGEKTETVSNKWEVKNRHWGPWSRSFCFPALHSCWGPDERKERKTTEVWEFVNAHKH